MFSSELLRPLLAGLQVTLLVTAGGVVVALVAAFVAGLASGSRHLWLKIPARVYVDLFRGSSALVQLFWAYFALPLLGVELRAMTVGIWVLGLNIGSYGAEVVRGAVQAVPIGQREAATALNFTPYRTLRSVVLPQALPAMLPPFGNLLIELLKSTALVSLITLGDLTFQGQLLRSTTLRSGEVFFVVMLLYFVVAQILAFGMSRLERRFTKGLDYGGVR